MLANPVLRRILELLLKGPHTVSEHPQVLSNARLVRDAKQGRQRYYRLEPARLEELNIWLSTLGGRQQVRWPAVLKRVEPVLDDIQ